MGEKHNKTPHFQDKVTYSDGADPQQAFRPSHLGTSRREAGMSTPTEQEEKPRHVPYSLRILQHPEVVRCCGFGNKDRRCIDPPPVVELVGHDEETGEEIEIQPSHLPFLIVHTSIWSEDGTTDVGLLENPYWVGSNDRDRLREESERKAAAQKALQVESRLHDADGIASRMAIPQQRPIPPSAPPLWRSPGYPYQQYVPPPQMSHAPVYEALGPGSPPPPPPPPAGVSSMVPYPPSTPLSGYQGPVPMTPLPTPSQVRDTSTHSLVGSLTSMPSHFTAETGTVRILYVFPDLSVRCPGIYRLRFRLVDLGSSTGRIHMDRFQPLKASSTVLSDPFTAYKPKSFPGKREPTQLSHLLAKQGILEIHGRGGQIARNPPPASTAPVTPDARAE
ncbi:velvet factor-domain-containing protein [Gaertneriomyces semiglobifer]|nr:velvet factor-domain-containing protein [Gaertneriomyces semiglobifer]